VVCYQRIAAKFPRCPNIVSKMEKINPLGRLKLRFLTKGAAAIVHFEESDSRIFEVNCRFEYRGRDSSATKPFIMVVALTEDLDSIKDSILEHVSTTSYHITLRLLWLGGPTPPLFNAPSRGNGQSCKNPTCRTLTPLNLNPWLRHWKDVECGDRLESKNRIIARLRDAIEIEGEEAGKPAAGGNHPKSSKRHNKRQRSTSRVPRWTDLPPKPDVVPHILRFSEWKGTFPKRGANSQTHNKAHAKAAESSRTKRQRNAAFSNREGVNIGRKVPALSQDNRGRLMMEKMGWRDGTGLGPPHRQCNVQPISQVFKTSKAGLGVSRSWDGTCHNCDLSSEDDSAEEGEIRRTKAKIRVEVGDESVSDDIVRNKLGNLPEADKRDSEREALRFLATIPLKPPR